jgi:hypothetical protein
MYFVEACAAWTTCSVCGNCGSIERTDIHALRTVEQVNPKEYGASERP